MLDTPIPADEDPGALDAGVLDAIRLRIETDSVSTRRYQRLLEWVAGLSRAMHQCPFGQLSLPEREHLLNELYHSSNRDLVQHRIDLQVVVRHCFHTFYSSPAAAGVGKLLFSWLAWRLPEKGREPTKPIEKQCVGNDSGRR